MILLFLLPLRFQPRRWPKKALKSPYVGRGFLVTHRFPSGCGHSSSSSLAFVCSGQRQIPQTKPFLLSHLTHIFNLSCASALFLFVIQYHHARKILMTSLPGRKMRTYIIIVQVIGKPKIIIHEGIFNILIIRSKVSLCSNEPG